MFVFYIVLKVRYSYNYCNDILFFLYFYEDLIFSCLECCFDKIYDNIVFGEWRNVFGMYDLGNNYEGGMKVV